MKKMWRIEDGKGNPVSKWIEGDPSEWVTTMLLGTNIVVAKECPGKVEVNWEDLYSLLYTYFHSTEAPYNGVDVRYFEKVLGVKL